MEEDGTSVELCSICGWKNDSQMKCVDNTRIVNSAERPLPYGEQVVYMVQETRDDGALCTTISIDYERAGKRVEIITPLIIGIPLDIEGDFDLKQLAGDAFVPFSDYSYESGLLRGTISSACVPRKV